MPSPGHGLFRGLLLAAAASLSCATDPCACPPAASALLVFGQVLAHNGDPVPDAVVVIDLGSPQCSFPVSAPPFTTATSAADGRFRTPAMLGAAGASFCLRATARQSATSTSPLGTVSGVLGEFAPRAGGLDSIGIVIRGE